MLEAPGRNATGWTLFFWLRIERAVQVCGAAYFGSACEGWAFKNSALVGHKYYSLRFNDHFQNYWISPSNPQISSLKKKKISRNIKIISNCGEKRSYIIINWHSSGIACYFIQPFFTLFLYAVYLHYSLTRKSTFTECSSLSHSVPCIII